jgi:thiol-disulfide isomerase/thioredoxin
MSAAKTRAQSLINDNAVVVFSKSYCPYCDSSKKLLDSLNAKYTTLELDLEGEFFFCSLRCLSSSREDIACFVYIFNTCLSRLDFNR